MKKISVLALLTILASCSGNGGGSSGPKQGQTLDPVTLDKFEAHIV